MAIDDAATADAVSSIEVRLERRGATLGGDVLTY